MDKNFNKKIGKVLKEKRNEKGFSLEYVGNLLGVTKNAVSNWELGKRSLYVETLREYCRILGCSVQEVFDSMDEEASA